MKRARRPRGFASRLFYAQALVIVAGGATLTLVAFAIAPGIFHSHVRRALGTLSDNTAHHVNQAFTDSVLLALGLAVAAALVAAAAISAFLAVRLARPVRALSDASRRIAGGHYSARVPVQGPEEVADLARSFNEMAQALESSEGRRRALLSDVAHELRTPLATLEGYVEGLADGAIAPDIPTWEVLTSQTRRMHRLVEDLSLVSKAEERQLDLRMTRLAPGALVNVATHAARPRFAEKGVALETTVEPQLPEVEADPDRFGEVLANLLDNALRHTPAGGRVAVGAGLCQGRIEITVADTGEGIAPKNLERVFERFFRTDGARSRTTGGSGIGLTIARAIVRAQGGEVTATSDGPNQGTRFVITLPVAPARPSGFSSRP
jgi:two-component system, OmpR family, sensor histidine kinase BaeS